MKAFLIRLLAKHGATIVEAVWDELDARLKEREDNRKRRDIIIDAIERSAEGVEREDVD